MVDAPPPKVAEWCGTLGSILPLRSREALQQYVLDQRINGHKFSIMLNQHLLADLDLPNVTGAASQKIRKCWHRDFPASVHVQGDLPQFRRPPPVDENSHPRDDGGPPQRPRHNDEPGSKGKSAPPPVLYPEEVQSQVDLLRAVLDCVCEKAGLDRQDTYLWVHGVVPNEVWQPMWDGLTVDLLRAQHAGSGPDRVSPRPSPRPTPRMSPRGLLPPMRSPQSAFGNSESMPPYGPPQVAWEAQGPPAEYDGESMAASSRRRSAGRSARSNSKDMDDYTRGPYEGDPQSMEGGRRSSRGPSRRGGDDESAYDAYDYEASAAYPPDVPRDERLRRRQRGNDDDDELDFARRQKMEDMAQENMRRQMEELHQLQAANHGSHDSPGSVRSGGPGIPHQFTPPQVIEHYSPSYDDDGSERSYPATVRTERSEAPSRVAQSEALSAWLDIEEEMPCMLPSDLADWLRLLPKERVPDEARKFVAARVLKDKIDGDRFGELIAEGQWEDLDIEDERVGLVIAKFFKNKQREDTMAEAARTTGAINRALKNKKGEAMVA